MDELPSVLPNSHVRCKLAYEKQDSVQSSQQTNQDERDEELSCNEADTVKRLALCKIKAKGDYREKVLLL